MHIIEEKLRDINRLICGQSLTFEEVEGIEKQLDILHKSLIPCGVEARVFAREK